MFNLTLQHQALIITGMHRSGTSLTASLLQSAGVNVGQNLMEASQGNTKGYYENLEFVQFHESILRSHGLAKEGWTLQPQVTVQEQYYERAKQLILDNQIAPVWGWKDPRTTLFLEFWQKLIPDAKFIFIFRSPWEVMDSLFRRGNQGDEVFYDNPNFAIELWINYNQSILNFYENFFEQCILLNLNTICKGANSLIEVIDKKFNISLGKAADLYDRSLLSKSMNIHRISLIKYYFTEAIDLYKDLNHKADIYDEDESLNTVLSLNNKDYLYYKSWVLQDWLNVRKLERELNQSHVKLQQTQSELEQSRLQLQQIQSELEQSRLQLQQTQSELEQSRLQLQQTQSELEQSRLQLQQIQSELEQSHLQLQQTQTELEQSHLQLQQTQTELQQIKDKLAIIQLQLRQVTEEWEITQSQLQQAQEGWEITQSQLQQAQEGWEITQSQLQQTQEGWETTKMQLQQVQEEWKKAKVQLQRIQEDWETIKKQLQHTKEKYQESEAKIQAMETSKFWKIRRIWFKFKRLVGINAD